jgi:hypothetical protein
MISILKIFILNKHFIKNLIRNKLFTSYLGLGRKLGNSTDAKDFRPLGGRWG